MNNNKLLSDYVYLAEASYTNFSTIWQKENTTEKDEAVSDLIQSAKKPENLATLVTDNYDVVAHYTNRDDESGFSGTLFNNKQNPLSA